MASYRPQKDRAFSLIELLIVFAIIAIISLIAIGSYANFRRGRQIRSAAENINSVFVAARSFAITSGNWNRVVFQLRNPLSGKEEYSYWIDELDPNPTGPPNPVVPPPPKTPKIITPIPLIEGVKIADVTLPSQVPTTYDISNSDYILVFFSPQGTSDTALVHLLSTDVSDSTVAASYYTVRLYGPTAKSKIAPMAKQ